MAATRRTSARMPVKVTLIAFEVLFPTRTWKETGPSYGSG